MVTRKDKKCTVRIVSLADGQRSKYVSAGVLRRIPGGGVALRYRQGRSFVALRTEGETVSMLREGEVYIRLCFCPNRWKSGEIGLSALSNGEVNVYTEHAEIFFEEGNEGIKILKISLDYILRFSAQEQRVSLQLSATCNE